MDREIIIPRKKSSSIKAVLLMLFGCGIFVLVLISHFLMPLGTTKMPVFLVYLSFPCLAVCLFCLFGYAKQLFNKEPVLVINEHGILQNWGKYQTGVMEWDDIEWVGLMPYMRSNQICIKLRNPEKYIKNPKKLARLNKPNSVNKYGHVMIPTLYFERQVFVVMENIRYYLNKHGNFNIRQLSMF
jgi:hypothetical protein